MRRKCLCNLREEEVANISVTRSDFRGHLFSVDPDNYRTITFCTPLRDTGGSISSPMGLTEFSTNMYTVGSSGTKNVAGVLGIAGPGVEPGVDLSNKSWFQDSDLVSPQILHEEIMFSRGLNTEKKMSTPSSHRGRRVALDNMFSDKAELHLLTHNQRKDAVVGQRQSRDKYIIFNKR
ncbi:uncharacterized protein LOC111717103 [Eurytemora carolleeae]|uniref:uncharacterized protein LOC111717103 n=1 Tax=Eurytemora carolleeae TaxID=1294199 RepID=UPI000C77006E|nr:uncharacterized protein LOC111717103 [Eurytemora carolleeae]|eukprot:XP_023348381.1 uncharacterized protein LOC111717103 [Eurytemora affinis]